MSALNEAAEGKDATDKPDADEISESLLFSCATSLHLLITSTAMEVDTKLATRAPRKRGTNTKVKKSKMTFKKARDKTSKKQKPRTSKGE